MSEVCFHAVGRRKKAIARVRLIPGEGNIIINKRSIDDYFAMRRSRPSFVSRWCSPKPMAASTSSSTARAAGLPARRRHPPWHRRALVKANENTSPPSRGRLSHPRSAYEGAQEIRSQSRSSRASVQQEITGPTNQFKNAQKARNHAVFRAFSFPKSLLSFVRFWKDLTLLTRFFLINNGATALFDPVMIKKWGNCEPKSGCFRGHFPLHFFDP